MTGTPPPSTRLRTLRGTTIDRDSNGNAIVVDANGALAPRLPFVELGDARFVTGFRGMYGTVRTIHELGFVTHADTSRRSSASSPTS